MSISEKKNNRTGYCPLYFLNVAKCSDILV